MSSGCNCAREVEVLAKALANLAMAIALNDGATDDGLRKARSLAETFAQENEAFLPESDVKTMLREHMDRHRGFLGAVASNRGPS